MKKLLIAFTIFLSSCSESDYQKIDRVLGINYPTDSTITINDTLTSSSEYEIIADTSLGEFEPFVEKKFDSVKVAKKADEIKRTILSKAKKTKPVKNSDGWRKNPELNQAYEQSKAFEKAKRDLMSIYNSNAKKSPNHKKDSL